MSRQSPKEGSFFIDHPGSRASSQAIFSCAVKEMELEDCSLFETAQRSVKTASLKLEEGVTTRSKVPEFSRRLDASLRPLPRHHAALKEGLASFADFEHVSHKSRIAASSWSEPVRPRQPVKITNSSPSKLASVRDKVCARSLTFSKMNECGQFLAATERAIGQRSKIKEMTGMPRLSEASVKLAVADENSSSKILVEGRRIRATEVSSELEDLHGVGQRE